MSENKCNACLYRQLAKRYVMQTIAIVAFLTAAAFAVRHFAGVCTGHRHGRRSDMAQGGQRLGRLAAHVLHRRVGIQDVVGHHDHRRILFCGHQSGHDHFLPDVLRLLHCADFTPRHLLRPGVGDNRR